MFYNHTPRRENNKNLNNENVIHGKLKITLKWIRNQRQIKIETSLGEGQKTKFNPYQNDGAQILNALLLEKLTFRWASWKTMKKIKKIKISRTRKENRSRQQIF